MIKAEFYLYTIAFKLKLITKILRPVNQFCSILTHGDVPSGNESRDLSSNPNQKRELGIKRPIGFGEFFES